MKYFSIALLLVCSVHSAFCQGNDLLVLKRRWKTIDRFYPGKEISFTNEDGQRIKATISSIRKDTVFLMFYDKRVVAGIFGLPQEHMLNVIPMAYNFRDIKTIQHYRKNSFAPSGYVLMVAGVGNLFLGFVNGLYFGDKPKNWYSRGNLWTSFGMMLGGFLLSKHGIRNYKLGRKYHLEYYAITPPAPAAGATLGKPAGQLP